MMRLEGRGLWLNTVNWSRISSGGVWTVYLGCGGSSGSSGISTRNSGIVIAVVRFQDNLLILVPDLFVGHAHRLKATITFEGPDSIVHGGHET